MDFLPINTEFEDNLSLRMTYEISRPNSSMSSFSNSKLEKFKNGVAQILIPMNTIHGISKTITRDNPQCAASVRFNAANIFGIKIEPKATAELVIHNLKEEINSGKRIGTVGESIISVVAQGYTSLIIHINSRKHPKSGHIAKVFEKIGGELFVIDTEMKIGEKRTGNPIPLDLYMKFLKQSGRNILDVVGLPTNRIAI